MDDAGDVIAELHGLRFRRTTATALHRVALDIDLARTRDALYRIDWTDAPLSPPPPLIRRASR